MYQALLCNLFEPVKGFCEVEKLMSKVEGMLHGDEICVGLLSVRNNYYELLSKPLCLNQKQIKREKRLQRKKADKKAACKDLNFTKSTWCLSNCT